MSDPNREEYTPTTESMRFCYRYANEGHDGSPVKPVREVDAEFDRWLDGIKAEAWDEGNRASRIMLPVDPPRYPTNPYRKREAGR